MAFLAKPSVALGFGAFFLCAATCAHFDALGTPWDLVPDWTAGIILVSGAVISRRDWGAGRQYQIAAWAFMVCLLFLSFLGNFQDWLTQSPEATGSSGLVSMGQGPYTFIVGILFGVALAGLTASLGARD